jgi:hypothetical protein
MGVAIQTYRARIGTFKHFRCGEMIANCRLSRGCDVVAIVPNINVSSDLKTVGCVIFIGVLLMISGVEPNPGPMENGNYLQAQVHTHMYTMIFESKFVMLLFLFW